MEKASFEAHPIWASVTELENLLDQAEEQEDSAASAPLASLRYLASTVRSHAEPSDTAPYSNAALTATTNAMSNVLQELRNYVSNRNIAHITNADSSGDQVLYNIGMWPTSILKGGAAAQANKVFMEYRDAAEAALRALRETNEELRAELTSNKTETDNALGALKSEIASLTAKITQDEARLDTALTTMNEAFTAKQTEREEKFNAFVQEQGEALAELAGDHLTVLKNIVSEAQGVYTEIDQLREGTEKVAGLASADILAGKFKEYSDQQWKWGLGANVLGFLTLAVGLGVIAWTLYSVGSNESISWQYTTLKLGVTITIVAASAVAFRLGGNFLSRSSTSKRMELELRAIGPFFADIGDPEALKESKRAFVERSFGRGWGERHSEGQLSAGDTSTLLKELVEIVKTVTTRS